MPDQDDIDTINDAIVANAGKPKNVSFGQRSVQQHSLTELADAADRLQGQRAAASDRPGLGLRFQQITPKYY